MIMYPVELKGFQGGHGGWEERDMLQGYVLKINLAARTLCHAKRTQTDKEGQLGM